MPEAQRLIALALVADPAEPELHLLQAALSRRRGRTEQSILHCQSALALRPGWADSYIDMTATLHDADRFDDALRATESGLVHQPEHAALHMNRGLMLRELGRFAEAQEALERACQIDPPSPEARSYLAALLSDLGESSRAEGLLLAVLKDSPQHAEAHWQLASIYLARGDFGQGWGHYQHRLRRPDASIKPRKLPFWDGRSAPAGAVLVLAEQGLGDEIMFASCVPDLLRVVPSCILECDARLCALFGRSFPLARIIPRASSDAHRKSDEGGESQIPSASLPALFRSRREDFPGYDGYLLAHPEKVAHWRERLDRLGTGLKVGISWIGGAPKTGRILRSMALIQLLPLLQQPNAHFVSLQFTDCRQEIAEVQARTGRTLHQWPEAISDYDETAALVAALDLVISVNTSLVHLAGALGRTTWMFTPAMVEWRFMRSGTDMPWYPKLRLFRQSRLFEWQPVVAAMAREFERLANRS